MTDTLTRSVEAIMRDTANRALMPHYQQLSDSQIISKAADDVVTVADHEAEAILSEALSRLLPDASIVGEEAAHADPALLDHLGDRLCWIIDPLDGTNNFARGKPPFGILIALAQAGETIGGWIFDPLKNRFCHGLRGGGAFIDGAAIRSTGSQQSPPVAAISLVFADPARRETLKTHIAPHYQLVDIPRCAAEQYPRLVLGENDLSVFERTLAWDHAAGALFLNESGGRAARIDGTAYRVDDTRKGMIGASTPALWDELAKRMQSL